MHVVSPYNMDTTVLYLSNSRTKINYKLVVFENTAITQKSITVTLAALPNYFWKNLMSL